MVMQYRQAVQSLDRAIPTKFYVVDVFLVFPTSVVLTCYTKFQHYRYKNVGFSSSKSRKFRIFVCPMLCVDRI